MKAVFPLMICAACSFSCVTSSAKKNGGKARLVSENLVLKKQITAIERRNTLLEDENNQMRKTVKIKDAEIEKTESNLTSAREQAQKEKKLFEEKYGNLSKKLLILDKESKGKIKEMVELNARLEKSLTEKIQHLNKEILSNKQKFAVKIEAMKKESAAREFNLNKKIISGKEVVGKLNKELLLSKRTLQDLEEKIKKETVLRESGEKKIQNLEKRNLELKLVAERIEKEKRSVADLNKKLNAEIFKLTEKEK